MFPRRKNVKYTCNYSFPSTKLRNVFCTQCKHQFFLEEFVPLCGIIPLLLDCGHMICNSCAKSFANEPCSICNTISRCEDQAASLPLNTYTLGLMIMSHNRPVNTDDSDISFSKSINSKSKQHVIKDFCHECGIEAKINCPKCHALYCLICYSKIHGKALQSHPKIMLSEGRNANSFAVQSTCSERCNEPLGYYCENCDIVGCSHCMLRSHKKHNYQSLLQKNKDLMPEFHSVVKRVQLSLQKVREGQKKLKSASLYPTKTQNIDDVESSITQHFAYLHGVLQNVEQKVIGSLQEQRNARNKNIDEISDKLSKHEDVLQSALMVTELATKNLDKINIQQVIEKLQSLNDIPCSVVIDPTSEDQEIKLQIDQSIVDSIKKHCNVYVPKASSYSLQQMKLLPEDYEIEEPLGNETNSPNDAEKSMEMQATSTVSLPARKGDNLPTVGSTETVRISHIVDPSCFYAQLSQNKYKLTELTRGLTTFAETTAIIPIEVALNTLYVVQSSEDSSWYRARVTDKKVSHGGEKYHVIFIDYGMKEENVTLSRVRNIIPLYAMFPIMALRCTLYDVVPNHGKWHPDATQAFKKLVSTNMMTSMHIMMITGDTYYVDLCVISSKDARMISMKESLTYMNYATCVSPNKLMRMNPGSTRKYYKEQLEMETYTHVHVLFIESPSSIYVQKAHANRSYFTKLVNEMTADYKGNMPVLELISAPYKDMPCAAIGANGFWHRGLICEVTETTVKVFFVDLGYTMILNHDKVRILSKKYMTCKTQAIKIELRSIKSLSGNRGDWDPEATDFLKKVLNNARDVKVIAFDKFDDTYSAVMYTNDKTNVASLLIKNSLALHVGMNPQNANTSNKFKNRKNWYKKKNVVRDRELPGVPYDDPSSTNVKNKSTVECEDPFKVCVVVHQAQSPDCIYVSDATYNHPDMEQMMKQMQEFYGKYRSPKRDVWNEDDTCAVYSSRSDMYYRARIVNIKSTDKVLVFLYDIGIEEMVSINDIQPLHPMYSKISTYVFQIKLTGILPCGGSNTWPSLSCEKLKDIINGNQNCKFYISNVEEEDVEDSVIPAELWIKQVKMDGPLEPTRHEINSVNRMLVEEGVALPVKEYAKRRDRILAIELKRQLMKKLERLTNSESNVKWFEINSDLDNSVEADINEKATKQLLHNSCSDSDENYNSDEFQVIPSLPLLLSWLPVMPILDDHFLAIPTYLDQNGFLYLHSKSQNAEILQCIELKLGKLYKNCSTESCDTVWAAGDMCIAQYHANKKWYRGKVVNVEEDDIIKVEFVDYGNVEECSIGTIKKKVVLDRIPVQCTKCMIYGLIPGTESGKWVTEDLDRIHSLLIEQECEITVMDRIDNNLVISVTIFPNNYCTKKCDLISFLIDKWKMNIKPSIDVTVSERSISTIDTPNVVVENSRLLCSDDEIITNPVISGNSVLIPHTNNLNKAESDTTTDIENLSWCKIKNEVITSTPSVASEENLAINYKTINIPDDVEYIEIELCCSISTTEFYAQLKENTHSEVLNTYYLEYERLMSDLQEFAYEQPMITSLEPNTPCCAKFDDDDLWYRCLITESESVADSDDVEIKLLFIDYGNSEYRTVNPLQFDLYALKIEWLDLPAMSIKCVLWNIKVAPDVDYSVLIPQLNKLYNKRVIATIKDIGEELVMVELYEDMERKEIMYNSLIEKGLLELESEIN